MIFDAIKAGVGLVRGAVNVGKKIKEAGGLRGIFGKAKKQDPALRAALPGIVAEAQSYDPKERMKAGAGKAAADEDDSDDDTPSIKKPKLPRTKDDMKEDNAGGLKKFILKLWWKSAPVWQKALIIGVPALIVIGIVWKLVKRKKPARKAW